MSDGAEMEGLLRRALAPVEPPASLTGRLEARLQEITDAAAVELEEFDSAALRDPRNWTRLARPAAAVAIGTGAGAALVVLRARRRPPGRGAQARAAVDDAGRALRGAARQLRRQLER